LGLSFREDDLPIQQTIGLTTARWNDSPVSQQAVPEPDRFFNSNPIAHPTFSPVF
jgi:hypothetical protein